MFSDVTKYLRAWHLVMWRATHVLWGPDNQCA